MELNERLDKLERGMNQLKLAVVVLLLLVCWLWADRVFGQQRIPTPADAAVLAAQDLASLPAVDHPFQRYVWIPSWWLEGGYEVAAWLANEAIKPLGHSVLIPPHLVQRDDVALARLDLRLYATNEAELQNLIDTWEQLVTVYFDFGDVFRADRALAVGTTEKQFQLLFRHPHTRRPVWVDADFVRDDGRWVWANLRGPRRQRVRHPREFTRWQHRRTATVADGVRAGLEDAPELTSFGRFLPKAAQTNRPILRLDVWARQIFTARDDDVYRGRYYEFKGIDGLTLNELLAVLGVRLDATNVSLIPLLNSGVTDDERIVLLTYGNQVRPTAGAPRFTMTFDPTEAQRDLSWVNDKDRFLREAVAHELLWTNPDGTQGAAAYKDQQQLDFVPDVVAANRKKPLHQRTVLDVGVGCAYCHSAAIDTRGYVGVPLNDFQDVAQRNPHFRRSFQQDQILKAFDRLKLIEEDAVGDRGAADVNLIVRDAAQVQLFNDQQVFEENAAQLFGSAEYFVGAARAERSEAIQRVTGLPITEVAQYFLKIYNQYEYAEVDAVWALRDFGFECADPAEAPRLLQRVLGKPVGYEDFTLGVLLAGRAVKRGTWEPVYKKLAIRAADLRQLHRN